MKYVNLLLIMLSLLVLSSCGGKSSESHEFLGTWLSECVQFEHIYQPQIKFHKKTVSFSSDSSFSLKIEYFEDNCTGTIVGASNLSGVFTIGNDITASSGVTAKEINFNFNGVDSNYAYDFEILDIIHKNNNSLYLGTPNLICLSLYELYDMNYFDLLIERGPHIDYKSYVERCYLRPFSIGFQLPYSTIEI